MTTISEAQRLARDLMDSHGLDGWSFALDNARQRAGQCSYTFRRISLSRHFVRLNGPERIKQTMLHEIAHALVGPGQGHNAAWRRKCLAIGGDGQRCYDAAETEMPPAKYLGVCTANPLHTFARHKATRHMREGNLFCDKCRCVITWSIRAQVKHR